MNQLFTQAMPHSVDDGARPLVRVFVRDLVLDALIGVYEHEKEKRQRVRINIDLGVDLPRLGSDHLADVVSYEDLVIAVREIVGTGHINLVETLADLIARRCLADPRVRMARVRIEKLDVFADTASVGVEIERFAP